MPDAPPTPGFVITGKAYDTLKWVALIALPAVATLYLALAGLWDLPEPEKVSGSIMAIDAFMGILLHLSSNNYDKSDLKYDGAVHLGAGDGGSPRIEVDQDLETLEGKKELLLKVNPAA